MSLFLLYSMFSLVPMSLYVEEASEALVLEAGGDPMSTPKRKQTSLSTRKPAAVARATPAQPLRAAWSGTLSRIFSLYVFFLFMSLCPSHVSMCLSFHVSSMALDVICLLSFYVSSRSVS
jgi:hypothetical protein